MKWSLLVIKLPWLHSSLQNRLDQVHGYFHILTLFINLIFHLVIRNLIKYSECFLNATMKKFRVIFFALSVLTICVTGDKHVPQQQTENPVKVPSDSYKKDSVVPQRNSRALRKSSILDLLDCAINLDAVCALDKSEDYLKETSRSFWGEYICN